jgi:hypothetical protein
VVFGFLCFQALNPFQNINPHEDAQTSIFVLV